MDDGRGISILISVSSLFSISSVGLIEIGFCIFTCLIFVYLKVRGIVIFCDIDRLKLSSFISPRFMLKEGMCRE